MASQYKLEGMDALSRKLKRLPVNIRKRHAGNALRKGARLVRDDAKRRFKPHKDTGLVDEHIKVRTLPKKQVSINADLAVAIGVELVPGKPPARHYAGRSSKGNLTERYMLYWIAHEFGSVKMEKHPFLRPAFYAMTPASIKVITKYMRDRIEYEARTLR